MTEETNKDQKKCSKNKGIMFAYGITQLGANVISALSLVAIAFSLCSIKQESKIFVDCVEEIQKNGRSASSAVRFCKGADR